MLIWRYIKHRQSRNDKTACQAIVSISMVRLIKRCFLVGLFDTIDDFFNRSNDYETYAIMLGIMCIMALEDKGGPT